MLIIDTAGRLHTSEGLMDELKKVARVITKRLPGAPHETLLVLDGTIGQNAVQQAKMFSAAVPVTGLVVTKLDGTARGGVVVAVHEAIDVPVKFLGVGESADDSSSLRRGGVRAGAAEASEWTRRRARGRHAPSTLDTPVTYLKGRRTGARRGAASGSASSRRAICSIHVPHRYEDASTVAPIASLEPGMQGTVVGTRHLQGRASRRAKGLRIFQAVLRDDTGMIEVSWPGQPFLDRTIAKGDVLLVTGQRALLPRAPAPAARVRQPRRRGRRRPRRGACSRSIRRPKGCRSRSSAAIVDAHLDALLAARHGVSAARTCSRAAACRRIADALRMVHRPSSIAEAMRGAGAARVRGAVLRAAAAAARQGAGAREARRGIRFENKRELTTQLREALPFTLTGAQVRAMREIVADMCSDRRMQRLLQGDVGSGKTIVALFAALLAMENGYQAAIMAPTELLAEQHARTMTRLLAPLGIAPMLVTGSLTAKARREVAARLADRRAGARRRHARARAGGDVVRASSASPRSTSSIASAWSSARRSARRARRPTCC